MATVHYQNGKFHVHREFIDNAKKDEPTKDSPSSKKESSINDHTVCLEAHEYKPLIQNKKYPITAVSSLLAVDLRDNYPPPKA